jgi:hypothetical protein
MSPVDDNSQESEGLKMDMHIHTKYSNLKHQPEGYLDRSYNMFSLDSNIEPQALPEEAYRKEINVICITDHNNLKGYYEVMKVAKKDYPDITVVPGEEITTLSGHILAYGISEAIRPGLSVLETRDEIHKQGGIGVAAHPRAVDSATLFEARHLPIYEGFNAPSLDHYSNVTVGCEARDLGKILTVGSDAHIPPTVGCALIDVGFENNLEAIIKNIKNANFKVIKTKYATIDNLRELLQYKLSDPSAALNTIEKHYGCVAKGVTKFFIDSFVKNRNAIWSLGPQKIFENRLKQLSKNLFFKRNDPQYVNSVLGLHGAKSIKILEALAPISKNTPDYEKNCDLLEEYEFKGPIAWINQHNKSLRPAVA